MKTPLEVFTLSLVLALTGPARVHAHSANEPAPRGDQGWKDRQELLNKRAAEVGEKAQVIFLGDSITQGWEGEGKEVWAKYYAHRNAVNLGIGGDRTQHVLWRLDNGNLNGLNPKAAVLMIGTNNSNGEDNSVEQIADAAGFSIVREYVGHGVGRDLHEAPQIPNYGPTGRGYALSSGLVVAIEPMINAGGAATRVLEDGWTVVTADGSLSAHFEHTVAVTADGPLVLTRRIPR